MRFIERDGFDWFNIIVFTVSFLILLFLNSGCEHKVKLDESKQTVAQEGESFTYVTIRLEYLEQIKEICTEANPQIDFTDEVAQAKAIAECTLKNMNIFNIDIPQVTDFNENYCEDGADLSEFTPEEIANIEAACLALENL